MITILEKYEHNVDFYQIVDFIEASHIRIKTTDEGTKILATVDGKLRTIFESSIRRNLKLNDEEGISTLPDAKLFENLALMGYNILPNQKFTFQKGQFSHQWKYLIHTIMQCLSPKSTHFNEFSSNIATDVTIPLFDSMLVHQGKGSGTLTEPHYMPSPEAQQSPPTAPSSPSQPTRKNIIKTSALPHDSTSRVTSLATDEGSMQQLNELTDLCTRLQRQHTEMATKIAAQDLEIASLKAMIKMLEDKDGGGAEPSGEDATIKGRSLETEEEAAIEKSTERGSNDTDELINVLTTMDAATILTSGVQAVSVPPVTEIPTGDVPTGSGQVLTASLIFTTASVVTPYSRRKIKLLEDKDGGGAEPSGEDATIKGRSLETGEEAGVEKCTKRGSNDTEELEVSEEDLKEMMQLVPVEEVYVEALQVKHPIID
nr:hypothetical protein [Tanacetum cinerariifolium]